jgi:3D (Asp-Asp-Asp) domain-containing protein
MGYANGADGGAVGDMTASGVHTHWGTVAADWRLYPPGTRLQIEGFPDDVFTVEDTGGGVRGNIIDVWFPELAAAVAFGTRSLRVTVLANGEN